MVYATHALTHFLRIWGRMTHSTISPYLFRHLPPGFDKFWMLRAILVMLSNIAEIYKGPVLAAAKYPQKVAYLMMYGDSNYLTISSKSMTNRTAWLVQKMSPHTHASTSER